MAVPRGARKLQIIERAVELMQEKGFLGTSIQDVTDQLDFTKAAFYYFVKNNTRLTRSGRPRSRFSRIMASNTRHP